MIVEHSGTTLSISAEGYLNEDIEDGAKVHITVKYGVITLINQETDLCEQTHNVDLECPLEKGELKLTKDVDLPKEIPPVRILRVLLRRRRTMVGILLTRCIGKLPRSR